MPPDRIVIVADPVGRLLFQTRERRPRAGVDQLLLIRREERFRYSIIVADTSPSERPPDFIPSAVSVEHQRRILTTAVRMKYHPGRRFPGSDGHVEGGGDQAGPHVGGGGPADDFA